MQGARRLLSQDLVALWVDEYGPALALMRRIFPPGLMRYLSVKKPALPPPQLINPSQPVQACLSQTHCNVVCARAMHKLDVSLPASSVPVSCQPKPYTAAMLCMLPTNHQ